MVENLLKKLFNENLLKMTRFHDFPKTAVNQKGAEQSSDIEMKYVLSLGV